MRELPWGAWPSPVTAELVGEAGGNMSWADQPDGALWWVQSLPAEGGRLQLMRDDGTGPKPVTSPEASVRTRVHEYGGRPWAYASPESIEAATAPDVGPGAGAAAAAIYCEWRDQRLYLQPLSGDAPRPFTPESAWPAELRYVEPVVVGAEVWATRERHLEREGIEVVREFIAVPLDGSAAGDAARMRVLGGEQHFLACLRVSADGKRAAWIGWDHPFMPWDQTELIVVEIINGVFKHARAVAGGRRANVQPVNGVPATHTPGAGISICQVEWDADGSLLMLSDETGWWNLYRVDPETGASSACAPLQRELGGPLWQVGLRWFAQLEHDRFGVLDHGAPGILDARNGALEPIAASASNGLPTWGAYLSAHDGRLASIGSGPLSVDVPVAFSAGTLQRFGDLTDALPLDTSWLVEPQLRWFSAPNGVRVPTNIYPPTNPGARGPAGELPPYVIHIHGGPSGENGTAIDLDFAYFTSRGIGVAVPEYGGSTGFGRAWRERLNGAWGVVDLADAETVARGLIDDGIADPARLFIRGGSAGGFTTALAMATPSSFAAGCARYPVISLEAFASGETHDFESQYLVGLVGSLPHDAERFKQRSPAAHVDGLHGALLIQQGTEDRVCEPQVVERFVAEVQCVRDTSSFRYESFDGEQHGFRQAATIARAIASEFRFLCDAVGIPPHADASEHNEEE